VGLETLVSADSSHLRFARLWLSSHYYPRIIEVNKTVAKFSSVKEASEADENYYLNLTSEERAKILFSILWPEGRTNAAIQRCARIYKLTESKES
jgi:hypothetical protein